MLGAFVRIVNRLSLIFLATFANREVVGIRVIHDRQRIAETLVDERVPQREGVP
jgi:hypothetical protein